MSDDAVRASRKRKLPKVTYHLLGEGLRAKFRSKWLRVIFLVVVYFVSRLVVKLAILPTVGLMFFLRYFVMNPLPAPRRD